MKIKLKHLLKSAVEMFLARDSELLKTGDGVHEQAISHRIAVYLEQSLQGTELEGYHVDCEYNRRLHEPKYQIDFPELQKLIDESGEYYKDAYEEFKERLVRPDIIIHKRGVQKYNLLVVEIKKKSESQIDIDKLEYFTIQRSHNDEKLFKYKLGVHIWFKDYEPQYKWFQNGQEVRERDISDD